jgi:integrase
MLMKHLQRQGEERSGYAANKDRKNLVAAWNWGMRYLEPPLPQQNPCLVHKLPEQRTPRYIPPEEDFWRVYQVAEGQDKVMLLAFLYLAARRGEIFRLKVEDLDFPNRRVRLSTRKREGGNLEYDWLPMVNELAEALQGWLIGRPVKSESVFVCLDETPLSRDYYGMPFQYRLQFMSRLCDKAGVRRFGFHAIRHLTATSLYKQGQSVGVIQAILRHTSPSTTERYLKTLGLEAVRGALEAFSNRRAPVLRLQPKAGAEDVPATAENKKAV